LVKIAAGTLILASFLVPGKELLSGLMPSSFPWSLFVIGFVGGSGFFLWTLKPQTLNANH
jgi:hypothetical protein|tara:strand:- start:497 stop:676 length:180 start_codon:yes stop_codon:yes gene_type:complete